MLEGTLKWNSNYQHQVAKRAPDPHTGGLRGAPAGTVFAGLLGLSRWALVSCSLACLLVDYSQGCPCEWQAGGRGGSLLRGLPQPTPPSCTPVAGRSACKAPLHSDFLLCGEIWFHSPSSVRHTILSRPGWCCSTALRSAAPPVPLPAPLLSHLLCSMLLGGSHAGSEALSC